MKKNIKIVLITIIPIIISVISLALSIFTFLSQEKGFSYLYEDDVSFSIIKKSKNHTTEYIKGINGIYPAFFSAEYSIAISNKSSLPITIISYEIENNDDVKVYRFYSDKINNHNIPIIIDGKKSITVDLKIFFPLPPVVDEIINKKYSYGSNPVFRDFKHSIYRQGYDLFGNRIYFKEYENDNYVISYEQTEIKMPNRKLVINTSMGKTFKYKIPYIN